MTITRFGSNYEYSKIKPYYQIAATTLYVSFIFITFGFGLLVKFENKNRICKRCNGKFYCVFNEWYQEKFDEWICWDCVNDDDYLDVTEFPHILCVNEKCKYVHCIRYGECNNLVYKSSKNNKIKMICDGKRCGSFVKS